MTYEEVKIQLDLNEPIDILKSIGRQTKDNDWFIVCDEGDCHLFNNDGNEIDVKKIKSLDEGLIPGNIEKIIIPDSVKYIRDWVFYNCINLTSINIPDSVESIGYWAFYKCEKLKSIRIPDSVKSIESSAFYSCINLISITIPDSVKSIGAYAFARCESLTSINIPESIEYVRQNVFYNCKNLKSLTFKEKTIDQVKSMEYYPFGLEDESIIKCIN